ncbi:MAG: O-methyltransferase [Hyphomicrobiales bacterium]|nr:O-methyltransferase [Hyphomicrobiales bacterium]
MSGQRIEIWDKILPQQSLNNEHYRGTAEEYPRLLLETIMRASGIGLPREELDLELSDRVPIEAMASSPVGLRLLQVLVALTGARRVFEVGTYIGLSAMAMARALPAGGEVVTVEKFDHFAAIARRNFERNGLVDRITLLEGDAFDVVERLPPDKPFDMIFIDGNKERYPHYFRALEPHLRPGGLAIIDDCLFHGDVLNKRQLTEKGAGAAEFLGVAEGLTGWLRLLLPISNGIMLMIKPAA